MDDALVEYRKHLVATLQKVSESYDKTIITLSGGALGISFAFLSEYFGDKMVISPGLLIWGWFFLTVSLAAVLFSLFFGTLAFRRAIKQVDEGTIYNQEVGGSLSKVTMFLHSSGAVFFLIGLVFLGIFMQANLTGVNNANKSDTSVTNSGVISNNSAWARPRQASSSSDPGSTTSPSNFTAPKVSARRKAWENPSSSNATSATTEP